METTPTETLKIADEINVLEFILIAGIVIIGILVIHFLIVSGKKNKKDAAYAFGLPQGSVRALLALTLNILFIFVALFFYLDLDDTLKKEMAKDILTILGTLVIAISSFYFGVKATEQGNEFARETFRELIQNKNNLNNKNIPVAIIHEAISNNKEEWKKLYDCIDIKLGKKKSNNTLFDMNCITFVVQTKSDQTDINRQIPSFIEYIYLEKSYNIPTDVIVQVKTPELEDNYSSLSLEQQYQIIEKYIEEKGDDLLDNYPSINGVSAAKKQRGISTLNRVSLQLQVTKKSDKVQDLIPSTIVYNEYQIPTDVVEAGPTKATFSINPVKEGVSRLGDNSFGSLGFPVYYNGDMHILSCYHVLFAKELNQGTLVVNQANSDTVIVSPPYSGVQNKIGDILEGRLTEFLDVGIMKPTEKLKNIYEEQGFSKEYAYLRREQENVSYFKFYGSKSQNLKKPDLLNIATMQPIEYLINGRKEVKRIRGLIQLSNAALKGDSGSAIYDYHNRVAGIIVAADDQFTYAISAYNILKKTDYSLNP
jgi:hypothetical protein